MREKKPEIIFFAREIYSFFIPKKRAWMKWNFFVPEERTKNATINFKLSLL